MRKMRIAAIDIGGTFIKYGSFENDALIYSGEIPNDISGGLDSIKKEILKAVDLASATGGFDGIAVSSAGDIDPFKGICTYATENLPGYTGFDIKSFLSAHCSKPVSAVNDGHAALLGELKRGNAEGFKRVIMLTLGTGVGGAYAENGKIIFGDDFTLGRFGHIVMKSRELKACNSDEKLIEQHISATALMEKVRLRNLDYTDCRALFSSFKNDDAAEIIHDFTNDLAHAIMTVYARIPFDAVIIGGGLSGSYELYCTQVQGAIGQIKLLKAALGNNAGLIGAYEWFKIQRNQV